MTTTRAHRCLPHTVEDILAVARQPDAAPPCELRVRPELYVRIEQETGPASVPVTCDPDGRISHLHGIPLIVDDGLPAFPGYEVHRAHPRGTGIAA